MPTSRTVTGTVQENQPATVTTASRATSKVRMKAFRAAMGPHNSQDAAGSSGSIRTCGSCSGMSLPAGDTFCQVLTKVSSVSPGLVTPTPWTTTTAQTSGGAGGAATGGTGSGTAAGGRAGSGVAGGFG